MLAILISSPVAFAHAQTPASAPAQARADEAETLDTVTVTATPRHLRRLPASASIIDAGTLRGWCKPDAVIYDVKSALPRAWVDGRL